MEVVAPLAPIALALVCIFAAVVAVYVLYLWEQVIARQYVSVSSCRGWSGVVGWLASALCVVIWIVYVIEIIFFILVCVFVVVMMVYNILAIFA